jgi:hypothetical protein
MVNSSDISEYPKPGFYGYAGKYKLSNNTPTSSITSVPAYKNITFPKYCVAENRIGISTDGCEYLSNFSYNHNYRAFIPTVDPISNVKFIRSGSYKISKGITGSTTNDGPCNSVTGCDWNACDKNYPTTEEGFTDGCGKYDPEITFPILTSGGGDPIIPNRDFDRDYPTVRYGFASGYSAGLGHAEYTISSQKECTTLYDNSISRKIGDSKFKIPDAMVKGMVARFICDSVLNKWGDSIYSGLDRSFLITNITDNSDINNYIEHTYKKELPIVYNRSKKSYAGNLESLLAKVANHVQMPRFHMAGNTLLMKIIIYKNMMTQFRYNQVRTVESIMRKFFNDSNAVIKSVCSGSPAPNKSFQVNKITDTKVKSEILYRGDTPYNTSIEVTFSVKTWTPISYAYAWSQLGNSLPTDRTFCNKIKSDTGSYPITCYKKNCPDSTTAECYKIAKESCCLDYTSPDSGIDPSDALMNSGSDPACLCLGSRLSPITQQTIGNKSSMCFSNYCTSNDPDTIKPKLDDVTCSQQCNTMHGWLNGSNKGNSIPQIIVGSELNQRKYTTLCGSVDSPKKKNLVPIFIGLSGLVVTIAITAAYLLYFTDSNKEIIATGIFLSLFLISALLTVAINGEWKCVSKGKAVCVSSLTKKEIKSSLCSSAEPGCECTLNEDCSKNGKCVFGKCY